MNFPGVVRWGFVWLSVAAGRIFAAGPETWAEAASLSSNRLNYITYADGTFLAVGDSSSIVSSTDGVGWVSSSEVLGTAPLYSAAKDYRGWYVGGAGLFHRSTDMASWTNTLQISAAQTIYAMLGGSPVAIVFDSGTLDTLAYHGWHPYWWTNAVPTTNAIYGTTLAAGPDGYGRLLPWPFAAVGDRGTILTSTNGTDWVPRHSGTIMPLRAVVYHQGRFIAGGDGGITLQSSDGVAWSPSAPTSFNVRGLASSGLALVAVGEHNGSGRLQASEDGLTWPGAALEFEKPFNSVAFGKSRFIAVGDNGIILESSPVPDWSVNAWTNAVSGYWEQNSWSWGRLPAPEQSLVAITNAGWKAVAIGPNTSLNYSNTLSIQSLTVSAPDDSFNQLLLNYAGTNAPLRVGALTIGMNASLASYSSALEAENLFTSSPVVFTESVLQAHYFLVGADLTLSNSYLTSKYLMRCLTNTTITHSGGTADLRTAVVEGSAYAFTAGILAATNLSVQGETAFYQPPPGFGRFTQSGGTLRSEWLSVGHDWQATGEFRLTGGSLNATKLQISSGTFTQTGGTNSSETIIMPHWGNWRRGEYQLIDGCLDSGDVTLGFASYIHTYGRGIISQSGGVHSNATLVLVGTVDSAPSPGSPIYREVCGVYNLDGGTLSSESEKVSGGTFNQNGGTNRVKSLLINWYGDYNLSNGILSVLLFTNQGVFRQQGGTLQLSSPVPYWGSNTWTGGTREYMFPLVLSNAFTLDLAGAAGTTLRYADSSQTLWTGYSLRVLGWRASSATNDSHHLFFGTNSSGLTSEQLAKITFVNPDGLAPGIYPARILETGEVVPAAPPQVAFIQAPGAFILSWPDNYELLTATNVTGPYLPIPSVVSPFTNPFIAPQQYFQLALPRPKIQPSGSFPRRDTPHVP